MRIRAGYELTYECPQPTAMLLALNIHPSRRVDLLTDQVLTFSPEVEARDYVDGFGNVCTRVVAPQGALTVSTLFDIHDSGQPDVVAPAAPQHDIRDLPDDALVFLLGSRYCETERLMPIAWQLFGHIQPGWARVQAICDYVHNRLSFGYGYARATRTAAQAHEERVGVCRDFAHLAVALCRAMGIPARYTTGYLGDIGVPPAPCPMDFSAWFEAWLEGGWYAFDARHNTPRIGRIPIAHGRDATDVAFVTSFGAHRMLGFKVWTDELAEERRPPRTTRKTARRGGTAGAPLQAASA